LATQKCDIAFVRGIFLITKGEVSEQFRILKHEEFRGFCTSQSIVRRVKYRTLGWEEEKYIRNFGGITSWETSTWKNKTKMEEYHQMNLGEIACKDGRWIALAQGRVQWRF
jgi:hypothetical protein